VVAVVMCNNKQHQRWAETYATMKHKRVTDVDIHLFGNRLNKHLGVNCELAPVNCELAPDVVDCVTQYSSVFSHTPITFIHLADSFIQIDLQLLYMSEVARL